MIQTLRSILPKMTPIHIAIEKLHGYLNVNCDEMYLQLAIKYLHQLVDK